MKLYEVLDAKVDIEVTADGKALFQTEAVIGGRVITFSAFKGTTAENKDRWLIEFAEEDSTKLTGNGKEFEVFSMIKQSVEMLIKKHHPKQLRFAADKGEGARASLYERFVKRYMKDWAYEKIQHENMTQFLLTKK